MTYSEKREINKTIIESKEDWTLTESLKDKLTKLADITEKDYRIVWNDLIMVVYEVDGGQVVISGSANRCENCIDMMLLSYRFADLVKEMRDKK